MNSTATICTEPGQAGTTGRFGIGHRRVPPQLAGGRAPTAAASPAGGTADLARAQGESRPESSGRSSRSEREQEQRRNAAARRKLEARREQQLLRSQLTEPWDEIGSA